MAYWMTSKRMNDSEILKNRAVIWVRNVVGTVERIELIFTCSIFSSPPTKSILMLSKVIKR